MVLICIKRDGASWRNVSEFLVVTALGTLVVGLINTTWLAWWGGSLSLALRVPQARLIRSAPDISGVSLTTWVLAATANVLWAFYGLFQHDHRILITCTAVSVASISLCIGVIKRRGGWRADPLKDPHLELEVL